MTNATPFNSELVALLRAWPQLIVVHSLDYQRVRDDVHAALKAIGPTSGAPAKTHLYRVTATSGIVIEAHDDPAKVRTVETAFPVPDPLGMLDAIWTLREKITNDALSQKGRHCVGVLIEDAHHCLSPETFSSAPFWAGKLRELAEKVKSFRQGKTEAEREVIEKNTPRFFLFVVGAERSLPETLRPIAATFRYPLPGSAEIDDLIGTAAGRAERMGKANTFRGNYRALNKALQGLPANSISMLLTQSLVKARDFGPDMIALIQQEKRSLFDSLVGGVATFTPAPRPFEMAGYEGYKALVERTQRALIAPKAVAWPLPLGALLIGPPGTGKTEMARYTAARWGVPIISVSLGGLQNGTLGSGLTNLRALQRAVEAIGPCILFLDELLKAVDTTENAKRGGGTSEHLKVLAEFMTWMETRERGPFILATGNTADLRSGLPEGLLERFPYTFAVDKPDEAQRQAIWALMLKRAGASVKGLDLGELSKRTDGLVGRDIRTIVDEALGQAFDAGKSLAQDHCEAAIALLMQSTVPVGEAGLRALPAGARRTELGAGLVHDANALA